MLFARAHGTNVTALVEALGLEMSEWDSPEAELPGTLQRAVTTARAVASQRLDR